MLNLSHSFADLMSSHLLQNNIRSKHMDLIIPMPMHPKRLQERGFNQALEIAKRVSSKLEIALDFTSCIRNKFTPPQASLPLKERVKNIHGVFSVKDTAKNNLKGLRVALIDDVMTTGASLNELAKTIKKAGASHVECWVIARTLPK
jgi:ComF family protein